MLARNESRERRDEERGTPKEYHIARIARNGKTFYLRWKVARFFGGDRGKGEIAKRRWRRAVRTFLRSPEPNSITVENTGRGKSEWTHKGEGNLERSAQSSQANVIHLSLQQKTHSLFSGRQETVKVADLQLMPSSFTTFTIDTKKGKVKSTPSPFCPEGRSRSGWCCRR